MKLVAKQVDVIAGFLNREKPRPYRLRVRNEDGEDVIIKVEKVIQIRERAAPGIRTFVYECQSTKGMEQYRFELLYNPSSHSWLLYKI